MIHFQQPRRKFLQTGIVGFCTALFANLPKISFAKSASDNGKGVIVREGEGIHILTGRRKVPNTIKISKTKHGVDGISFCVEEQIYSASVFSLAGIPMLVRLIKKVDVVQL